MAAYGRRPRGPRAPPAGGAPPAAPLRTAPPAPSRRGANKAGPRSRPASRSVSLPLPVPRGRRCRINKTTCGRAERSGQCGGGGRVRTHLASGGAAPRAAPGAAPCSGTRLACPAGRRERAVSGRGEETGGGRSGPGAPVPALLSASRLHWPSGRRGARGRAGRPGGGPGWTGRAEADNAPGAGKALPGGGQEPTRARGAVEGGGGTWRHLGRFQRPPPRRAPRAALCCSRAAPCGDPPRATPPGVLRSRAESGDRRHLQAGRARVRLLRCPVQVQCRPVRQSGHAAREPQPGLIAATRRPSANQTLPVAFKLSASPVILPHAGS